MPRGWGTRRSGTLLSDIMVLSKEVYILLQSLLLLSFLLIYNIPNASVWECTFTHVCSCALPLQQAPHTLLNTVHQMYGQLYVFLPSLHRQGSVGVPCQALWLSAHGWQVVPITQMGWLCCTICCFWCPLPGSKHTPGPALEGPVNIINSITHHYSSNHSLKAVCKQLSVSLE